MTANEINTFLVEKTKEQSIRYSSVKADCIKKFGESGLFTSDITSMSISDSMPLDMKLRNIMAIANNNMVAGLYSEYRARGLEMKLEEEKKLKQTVFLFILKYGLMNEFRSFVSKYQGDVKEDIRCERMKHA